MVAVIMIRTPFSFHLVRASQDQACKPRLMSGCWTHLLLAVPGGGFKEVPGPSNEETMIKT